MPRESFDEVVNQEAEVTSGTGETTKTAEDGEVEIMADDLIIDLNKTHEAAQGEGGGIMRKLGEIAGKKGRAFVAGVGLMSAAAAGQMAPQEAEAHHVQGTVSKEEAAKVDYEHEILNLGWKGLLKIPDQPQALNEAHNKILQESVARNMIYRVAALLKVGKDYKPQPGTFVHVSPPDMKKAAELLNSSVGIACAEANGGRECSLDDINQFNAKLMQLPAGKALMEILSRP